MQVVRWVILTTVVALMGAAAVRAEDRATVSPGQGQAPVLRVPDAQLNAGPCAGATEITNQYGTCTPCLANSVAGRGNAVCVCSPGFVETGRDQWGRATCVAAGDRPADVPPQPQLAEVVVPAGAVFRRSAQAGFAAQAALPGFNPTSLCMATDKGDAIYAEYFVGGQIPGAPAPYDEADYTCNIVLMGAQLANGWQMVGLRSVDTSECSGSQSSFTLTKRTADPTDTTFDLRLTAWGVMSGFCVVRIREAVLRGPATGKWEEAFGG